MFIYYHRSLLFLQVSSILKMSVVKLCYVLTTFETATVHRFTPHSHLPYRTP